MTFQCSEARQRLLQHQEGERAQDRTIQRARAAQQHHDDQLAGTLPVRERGADELRLVAEQEAGSPQMVPAMT